MDDKKNKSTLEIFAQKASNALKRRKSFRTFTMEFPSFIEDDGKPLKIKFKTLNDSEINDIISYDGTEPNAADRYAVYMASCDPSLKDIAMALKEKGEIITPLEVMDMFEMHEILEASALIMKESGVLSDKKVTITERALDNLKN